MFLKMPSPAGPFARTLNSAIIALLAVTLWVPSLSAAPGSASSTAHQSGIAPPEVTAQAIYVMDMTSGVEMYAKDESERLPIGSIVKIATALVVIEHTELEEEVVIQESDLVDTDMYSNMDLQAGDTLTISQLLYGLLIPSGNDGAQALARHVGSKLSGSEDPNVAIGAFVNEMNAYAANLGLTDSRFTVPDGIDTPNAYSSAYDVTILAHELMKSDFLRSVVSEPGYRFTSVGSENRVYEKATTNNRLGQSGVIGVKTGTTGDAGGNVVLAREVNGGTNTVLITIIGAEHSFETGVDLRWDDADAIMADMDARFAWSAPNGDGVLPGLNEQMSVWDVQFQDPPTIPVPTTGDVALGYRLQIGEVADPGEPAGSLFLYFDESEVGSLPLFQASESARSSPLPEMVA